MAHYSYLDELDKQEKRSQLHWLFLISVISVVIIVMLVIIRTETNFFIAVQKMKSGLSNNERLKVEKRILATWARRDLGLDNRVLIEKEITDTTKNIEEASSLSPEERIHIEEELKN